MKVEIKLGTTLKELKLYQLVGIADYVDLIGKERKDEENEKLIEAIDAIFDLAPSQIKKLNGQHLESMSKMVFNTFNSIVFEYGQLMKDPKHYAAFTVIAKSREDIYVDKLEIEELREQKKGLYFNKRRKINKRIKELTDSHTPQLFRIRKDITKEPMAVWVAKLDNVDKVLQKIKPDKFYHQWRYISTIIAMIAWRDNEQRTKIVDGKLVVDSPRIDYISQTMLHLRADVAVRIFAFFFSTKNPSFRDQFLKECLKGLNTPMQYQAQNEKSTVNDGAGLVTS